MYQFVRQVDNEKLVLEVSEPIDLTKCWREKYVSIDSCKSKRLSEQCDIKKKASHRRSDICCQCRCTLLWQTENLAACNWLLLLAPVNYSSSFVISFSVNFLLMFVIILVCWLFHKTYDDPLWHIMVIIQEAALCKRRNFSGSISTPEFVCRMYQHF